ncbi:MAG: SEC-C metal-binding domain-containing protein [Acidimicrobiales bacterium]
MSDIGRNVACSCGSGLKYKRCCLRLQGEVTLDVAKTERVWGKMQGWAFERFGDELDVSLKEHLDARGIGTQEHPAMDDDLSVALCWFGLPP